MMVKNKLIGTLLLTYGLILFPGCQKKFSCSCKDGTQNIVYIKEIKAEDSIKAKEYCETLGIECNLQ